MGKRIFVIAAPVFICLPLILMFLAGSGHAQCETTVTLSCSPMRVTMCPGPGYEPIREGCGGDTDYIEIWARDQWGNPISGIPWTDYWIGPCSESQELLLCMDGFVADSVTSSIPGFEGRTTFSGMIKGGGCVLSGGVWLTVQGRAIYEPESCIDLLCLEIVLVSPDINGDGQVSLGDFSDFCNSYGCCQGNPDYDDCCDYTDNGCCSLEDFSVFVSCYQKICM